MKISVITVCYNSIATLQDTLESILRQTYPDMESIVVDGASKDGTVELIEKYSHQFSGRMKWLSEPDKGIYDAMNKGISMATGDIIGFLNADDYYQDGGVLETIAEAFARHGADAVHGNLHYINGAREIVRTWRGTEYRPGSFQRGWSPAHPTFYCKRDCFTRYGGFDPAIGSAADFELMLRFIEKNHISTAYIDRDMVFMRTGGSSTAGLRAILRNTRQNKQAFRKNNLPLPVALRSQPGCWPKQAARAIPSITCSKPARFSQSAPVRHCVMNLIFYFDQPILPHAGGTERAAYLLAQALSRHGHRVSFLSLQQADAPPGELPYFTLPRQDTLFCRENREYVENLCSAQKTDGIINCGANQDDSFFFSHEHLDIRASIISWISFDVRTGLDLFLLPAPEGFLHLGKYHKNAAAPCAAAL